MAAASAPRHEPRAERSSSATSTPDLLECGRRPIARGERRSLSRYVLVMPARPKPPQPDGGLLRPPRHDPDDRQGRYRVGPAAFTSRKRASGEAASGRRAARRRGPVAAVYTSPLERARETAAADRRALGKACRRRARAARVRVREWTGAELSKDSRSSPNGRPCSATRPGSASRAASRSSSCRLGWPRPWRRSRAHPGEVVVAVSHADPIKIALADALGVPLDLVAADRRLALLGQHRRLRPGRARPCLTVNSMSRLRLGLGRSPRASR